MTFFFHLMLQQVGTTAGSTAVIAETTLRRGETTNYVVQNSGEGYVNGFIGIKSVENYFSLAMEHGKRKDSDSDQKPVAIVSETFMWKLIESARAFPPEQQATCTPPRPVIP